VSAGRHRLLRRVVGKPSTVWGTVSPGPARQPDPRARLRQPHGESWWRPSGLPAGGHQAGAVPSQMAARFPRACAASLLPSCAAACLTAGGWAQAAAPPRACGVLRHRGCRAGSAHDHLFAGAPIAGGSGRRIMRNEMSRPRPDQRGWVSEAPPEGRGALAWGVDLDDLVLRLLRPGRRACFSSWVLLTTSASCSRTLATCCCSAPDSTVLDWAMLVKPADSTASKMAPANASPNDRPNDPPARVHPRPPRSTRSLRDRGQPCSCSAGETSRPSPAPAIINGTTRYQPEVARGTIGSTMTSPIVNSGEPPPG